MLCWQLAEIKKIYFYNFYYYMNYNNSPAVNGKTIVFVQLKKLEARNIVNQNENY